MKNVCEQSNTQRCMGRVRRVLPLLALLPMSLFAANSAAMCGTQSYKAVLTTCTQPGSAQAGIDACEMIIKNNCLSAEAGSAAVSLAAIHTALIGHYNDKGMHSAPAVASAHHAPTQPAAPKPSQALMQQSHQLVTSLVAPKPKQAQPVNQSTQHNTKQKKANYWF